MITQARELADISLRAATYEPNVQSSFKNDGAKIDASLIISHTGMSMLIVSPAEHADDRKVCHHSSVTHIQRNFIVSRTRIFVRSRRRSIRVTWKPLLSIESSLKISVFPLFLPIKKRGRSVPPCVLRARSLVSSIRASGACYAFAPPRIYIYTREQKKKKKKSRFPFISFSTRVLE